MRTEKDLLGELQLPDEAIYGINSLRSCHNFPSSGEKVNIYLISAYLLVKKACAQANHQCGLLDKEKYEYIIQAIDNLNTEAQEGFKGSVTRIYDKIIVDPYQGGAGTSLNMNINEVIANTAIKLSGRNYGDYDYIHPLDDINMSQSTNDTYITALKVASIYLLRELTTSFAKLQNSLQQKEEEFRSVIKLGRTEFQDAVPMTLGQEFGAYAQAIARDRWRLYNAEERLRSVNLGGTAIGNSISATREYVLSVNNNLKILTGLPIAKSEDLIDATQNLDVFVEVHGIIKAGAASLIKICNDLRFLSSGPRGGIGEISLPEMQAGSTIMPGKVNPVIPEYVIQIAELIKGHDVIITNLVSAGHLELNAFGPLLAHCFLKSLEMLAKANICLADNCIAGIKADKDRCYKNLMETSAFAAALINNFGYDRIAEITKVSIKNNISFIQALLESKVADEKEIRKIICDELGIDFEQYT